MRRAVFRGLAAAMLFLSLLAGQAQAKDNPFPADPGVLWASDYSPWLGPLQADQGWFRVQVPTTDGTSTGTKLVDRIKVVSVAEVFGSGAYKPYGKAMRVMVRPGDKNPQTSGGKPTSRAEVYDRQPPAGTARGTAAEKWPDPVGSFRWYAFSVYIPKDFTLDTERWFTFAQWKGLNGGSPPTALEIDYDRFELGGTKGRKDLGRFVRGTWNQIIVGMKLSTSSVDGWIQVEVNGRTVLPQTPRATMGTSEGLVDPIYLKQGIYRGGPTAWTATHWLQFGPTFVATNYQSVRNALVANSHSPEAAALAHNYRLPA